MVTGLWVEPFLFFGRIFQRVVNNAFYVSRVQFEVKIFFFKKTTTPFFGNWAKNYVSFLPIFSRNDCKKCLVPFQTNTCNQVIFSGKLSFSLFFGILVGKLRQGCQNNSLRWQKNKWGKWFYTSNDLILDIVTSH